MTLAQCNSPFVELQGGSFHTQLFFPSHASVGGYTTNCNDEWIQRKTFLMGEHGSALSPRRYRKKYKCQQSGKIHLCSVSAVRFWMVNVHLRMDDLLPLFSRLAKHKCYLFHLQHILSLGMSWLRKLSIELCIKVLKYLILKDNKKRTGQVFYLNLLEWI